MRTVVVDAVEIPERLIAEEAQHHPAASVAEARRLAGKALAVRAHLLSRAAELGLEPDPLVDEDGREETREEALIRAVLDAEVERVEPDAVECERFWRSRPDLFPAGDGTTVPFERAHEAIRRRLSERAWAGAAARYVAGLAETARADGVVIRLTVDGEIGAGGFCMGEMLSETAADRLGPWLAAVDPALGAKVLDAAETKAQPISEFIREAVAEFVSSADDEAWTRVVSAAQGASDPALACMTAILSSRLTPPRRTATLIRRV
jgi:hypothetical protein